jgi:hypothetical protein
MFSTARLSVFLAFLSLLVPAWGDFTPPYDPSPFNIFGYIDRLVALKVDLALRRAKYLQHEP